jgi:hypothetical protein
MMTAVVEYTNRSPQWGLCGNCGPAHMLCLRSRHVQHVMPAVDSVLVQGCGPVAHILLLAGSHAGRVDVALARVSQIL